MQIKKSERHHQYAKNNKNEWLYAPTHVRKPFEVYFCVCPVRHLLTLVKPLGKLGKRTFMSYFRHKGVHCKRGKGSHTSAVACKQAGETLEAMRAAWATERDELALQEKANALGMEHESKQRAAVAEYERRLRVFRSAFNSDSATDMDRVWLLLDRYRSLVSFQTYLFGEVDIDIVTRTDEGFVLQTHRSFNLFLLPLAYSQLEDANLEGGLLPLIKCIEERYLICREQILIVHFPTMLRSVDELEAVLSTPGMHVDPFKSCTWPILKHMEKIKNRCASCFQRGHVSEKCWRKFCTCCSRRGHTWRNCFARS